MAGSIRSRPAGDFDRDPWPGAGPGLVDHLHHGFILEGAGIVASVGYFLEGSPIAALLAVFVIATFWMNGPRAFDKE